MYQQPNNPPPYLSQGKSSSNNEMGRIENMFKQMLERNANSDPQIAFHTTSIRNLEVQVGQISQALNTRPKGALPSDTVVNPKGGNHTGHAIAVTIRSGRGGDASTSDLKKIVNEDVMLQEDDKVQANDDNVNDEVRIDNNDNMEETQNDVNPSREHVIDIPETFMKDLVTKKRYMNCETIKMTHQVSAIVHSMAPKLEDPDAFTIPCTIGRADFAKALWDLGASINLMSYSVFKTLGIGQPRATSMRLQMEDRSMKRPLGIIDDVLVRVDRFILPADFVILDCEVDYEVPIILGIPFLATRKTLVDVKAGELTFRVGNEKVIFHVCKSMRQPNSNEVCSFVDLVTEVIVDDTNAMINVEDPLEVVLLNHEDDENEGLVECANVLQRMGYYLYGPHKLSLDLENRKTPPTKPSIEEPPILELKPLPSHLSYEFLDPSSILPIILSTCLTNMQVDSTLVVLQRRKKAIGWTLADIRGISPAFCMHKIILEDDAKPFVEHQRRLNEDMQEVVKKEIVKWLDTGVVHLISDSSWTSPVQCVPKKGGMTVVTNEKNELIPTRTITGWRWKEKIEVISKLPPPTSVKGVSIFLEHARFYRRFIKDFSKVVNPLCKLLEKDTKFVFNEDFMKAFELLKYKLTTTPIITVPNWNLPFELMCDASDVAVGDVLGQRVTKIFYPVYYARKTMNDAQVNYTVTEKELLAIVFAMEKFRPYLMGAKVIVHTDHATLRYLMTKKDSKARLMRWVLSASRVWP
ncbi:uncharacterized protein [Nicotiana tomentosiformis]|uniref:uncharacterized protein n=1 Tax=Nicotiana tomentosiformis TaxID=4098 RepID=UPI00388C7CC1